MSAQVVETALCRNAVEVLGDMESTGYRTPDVAHDCSYSTITAGTSSDRRGVTTVTSRPIVGGTISVRRGRPRCVVVDVIYTDSCSYESIADDVIDLAGQVRDPNI